MKRGQAGFFVIMGLVLVVTTILIYFLVTEFQEDSIDGLKEVDVEFIQPVIMLADCLEENSNFSLRNVLLHGGFFNVSQRGLQVSVVAYYEGLESSKRFELFEEFKGYSSYLIVNGAKVSLSLDKVEEAVAESIYAMDFVCFNELDLLKDFNFEVGEKKVDVMIEESGVLFEFKYGVSFSNGEASYALPSFSHFLNSSAFGLIDDALTIEDSLLMNSSVVNMTLLRSLESNVSLYPYEGNLFFEMWRENETFTFLAKV